MAGYTWLGCLSWTVMALLDLAISGGVTKPLSYLWVLGIAAPVGALYGAGASVPLQAFARGGRR
jgi:hypothetical protein